MILRPRFMSLCESWRQIVTEEGVYRDVFDGQVWKDFIRYDGKPFLELPYNFGLHLNIDWFQPFEHTQHSEGVIYLTIMNMERKQRFLQENVILVGVIPGPKEPGSDINSFLRPMVNDLLLLWSGVVMQTIEGCQVVVRAALLCAACDIPAARKTCGFVGHSAYRGCSKCLVAFPTSAFGEKPDYSNFNQVHWERRTNDSHRANALKYLKCNTQSQQKHIEREYGIRYSVLIELPYFDAPRMCIVDPMHNLLLGTSKKMVDIWKKLHLLEDKDYERIKERMDGFIVPGDSGRQPSSKILSGFSGLTAEQWKSWTLYYSLFCLKDVLPFRHYQCWQLFVKACFLILRRSITQEELQDSDRLFLQFCLKFTDLYGKEQCTPNLHLHCHLKECVIDFGPMYAFWLFGFERLNGIMGSYHTNSRNISVQLMRRFLDSIQYAASCWPEEFASDFLPLLGQCRYNQGSLMQTNLHTEISNAEVCPLRPIRECSLSAGEVSLVKCIFDHEFGKDMYTPLLLFKKAKALKVGEYVVGSNGPRYQRSSIVLAKTLTGDSLSLARIDFYAECSILLNACESNPQRTSWLAAVSWFMEHPCRMWYGVPVQVWCTTVHSFQFIPINLIKCRVVYVKATVDFGRRIGTDTVYIVTPIER